jgi:hypothetical protein
VIPLYSVGKPFSALEFSSGRAPPPRAASLYLKGRARRPALVLGGKESLYLKGNTVPRGKNASSHLLKETVPRGKDRCTSGEMGCTRREDSLHSEGSFVALRGKDRCTAREENRG